jgi:Cu-Zn family superoxide dismutase
MTPQPTAKLFPALAAAGLLTACAHQPPPGYSAQLEPRSGSQVSGTVTFIPAGDLTRVEARVQGLTPGEHGFHIHEAGDCSAPDAMSAKGHFNPDKQPHGHHTHREHHAGDLPNLIADQDGKANYQRDITRLHLATGPIGIIGRSVVVHADPDDYKTQPAGNSGTRVACGVIVAR